MNSSEKEKMAIKPEIPMWARQPFEDYLDFTERIGEVVELATVGIAHLQGMPKILEKAAEVLGEKGSPDVKVRLKRAERLAELAKRESAMGFPLIHAQATVAVWGALEDLIRTFVAKWLQQEPSALFNPPLSAIKVAIGDYERLSPEEKGVFLADTLERSVNAAFKQGVTRFEAILQPIGLSGSVPDDIGKNIFELGQVRHVIVHRRGIADRRLLDACPWLTVQPGSPLVVTNPDLQRYHEAAVSYAVELMCRVGEHFGVSGMRDIWASRHQSESDSIEGQRESPSG